MNSTRKRLLAGLAATGVLAGGLAAGGVALASTGSTPAAAAATTATPSSGPCDGVPGGMPGMWSGRPPAMRAAAAYLGLSQAQLRAQLQSGKSLADVAKARGKSVSGLENAILAAMTSWINSSTTLSATQKAAMISQVKSHLDAIVNDTFPSGPGMRPASSPGWRMPAWDGNSPMGGMRGMM
jgi:hypothetical protein